MMFIFVGKLSYTPFSLFCFWCIMLDNFAVDFTCFINAIRKKYCKSAAAFNIALCCRTLTHYVFQCINLNDWYYKESDFSRKHQEGQKVTWTMTNVKLI